MGNLLGGAGSNGAVRQRWRTGTKAAAGAAVGSLILAGGGVAYADAIANRLDASVDSVAETMTLNLGGPNGTTQLYVVKLPDHGTSGCTFNGKDEALTLALASSNLAVATVSPATATFKKCEDEVLVTVTPQGLGTSNIVASAGVNTTGEPYDVTPVNFDVTVVAPAPSNTAPVLTISGVTPGTTYTKGSVPKAVCVVADKEDGTKFFDAALGPLGGPDATTGVGVQEAICSYTDNGDLTATNSVTYAVVDGTAPGISYTLDEAEPSGLNGWYRKAVTLTWTVTEGDSFSTLNKTGCIDVTVTLDQLPADYSCSASSSGGSAGLVTVPIKKDGTAPEVGFADATGRHGNEGWYLSDVTARFAATDATSGLTTTSQTELSDGEGEHVVVKSPVFTDLAGNSSKGGAASTTFKIDKTAPQVAYSGVTSQPNGSGWYKSDVQAEFSATDKTSGLASAAKTATTSGEGNAVTVGSPDFTDIAGNTAEEGASTSPAFKIDKTAPSVGYAGVTGTAGKGDWYVSDVEVTFDATDALSGVPVSSQKKSSTGDGGNVIVGSPDFTDNAGNTAAAGAAKAAFKIDTTPPDLQYVGTSPSANEKGWNNTDVTVIFGASDVTSGVDDATVTATASGQGSSLKIDSPAIEDRAGNARAAGSAWTTVNIDREAPQVSFTWDMVDSYFGSTFPEPACNATDALSGVVGGCAVEGYKTEVGIHTLIATATDAAGNIATKKQTYEVKGWAVKGFYHPVDLQGVRNTVKGGSTVPAKFEVFAGDREISDPALMELSATKVQCIADATEDVIETTLLAATSLKYDPVAGQFVYNWKTPTGAGTCYRLTMEAADGSHTDASFKLK